MFLNKYRKKQYLSCMFNTLSGIFKLIDKPFESPINIYIIDWYLICFLLETYFGVSIWEITKAYNITLLWDCPVIKPQPRPKHAAMV